MDAWLANLKAGDEVMIPSRYGAPTIIRVERVTPTQVLVGGMRFKKSSGFLIGGDSWNIKRICEPTAAGRDAEEAALLRHKLTGLVKDGSTTLQTLRAMFEASK